MAVALTFDELLRYTERRTREVARAGSCAIPRRWKRRCSRAGAMPTVGKLIDHIFLVERRHLQRLTDEPVVDRPV